MHKNYMLIYLHLLYIINQDGWGQFWVPRVEIVIMYLPESNTCSFAFRFIVLYHFGGMKSGMK